MAKLSKFKERLYVKAFKQHLECLDSLSERTLLLPLVLLIDPDSFGIRQAFSGGTVKSPTLQVVPMSRQIA